MPRILIIGQGAIGSLLAYQAHLHGVEYQVLSQRPVQPVTVNDGARRSKITPAAYQPSEQQSSPFCAVIAPLKAYQMSQVLLSYQDVLPEAPVVLMNNGMGVHDELTAKGFERPLLAATTRWGARKIDSNNVLITGHGETQLGQIDCPVAAHQQQVFAVFQHILAPTHWQQDIYRMQWDKLAINAVINPLTAVYQVPNGDLLTDRFREQLTALCEEIAVVMQAEGIPITGLKIYNNVCQVARATADNHSSMLEDRKHQRPTEIDYINGYVIKRAQQHGLTLPVNNALFNQLTAETPPRS